MIKELQDIRKSFQWTFENMGTPHTSDHFNIPANAIDSLDKIIAAIPYEIKEPLASHLQEEAARASLRLNGIYPNNKHMWTYGGILDAMEKYKNKTTA